MSRRTLQAVAIYLGAGWTGFGIVSWLVSRYGLDSRIEDAVLWTMLLATPAVAILASRRTRDAQGALRRGARRGLLVNALLVGLALLVIARSGNEDSLDTVDDDMAAALEPAAADEPVPIEERETVLVFFPSVVSPEVGDSALAARAFSFLLAADWEQDASLTVFNAYSFANQIRASGADPRVRLSPALERRIATQAVVDAAVTGTLERADSWTANLELTRADGDFENSSLTCAGADLFSLVDACTVQLTERIGSETGRSDDLPVAEVSIRGRAALDDLVRGLDAFLLESDYQGAREQMEKALQRDPESALTRVWLSSVLRTQGESEAGIEQLAQARRNDYRLTERMRFQTAANYFTVTAQPQEALGALRNWAELYPDSVEAQMRLGSMLSSLARFGEADAAFENVLRVQPENLNALNALVASKRRSADYEGALELAQEGTARNPESAAAHLLVASQLVDLGNLEQAEESARRAVSLVSSPVGPLRQLADIQFRAGEFEEAERTLARAEKVTAADLRGSIVESRSTYAAWRGALRRNLELLDELASLAPSTKQSELLLDFRRARSNLALQRLTEEEHSLLEQRVEALAEVEKIGFLPQLALLESKMGAIETARRRLDETEALVESYGLTDYSRYFPHWRGHVAEDAGELERAAELFRSALEDDLANVELGMEVGRVLRKAGEWQDAREILEQTLRRFPSYPEANLELAFALRELGDEKGALAAAEAADRGFAIGDDEAEQVRAARQVLIELRALQ